MSTLRERIEQSYRIWLDDSMESHGVKAAFFFSASEAAAETERLEEVLLTLDAHRCEACHRVFDIDDMDYEPEESIWFCKSCYLGAQQGQVRHLKAVTT